MDWDFIFSNTAAWLIAPETIAYAIATVGLAVHFGYGGLLNFGQAGFMAIGAYGYAISILSSACPGGSASSIGLVASVIFAFILGLPTLRLRADYLAIATIAAAEIAPPAVQQHGVRRVHQLGGRPGRVPRRIPGGQSDPGRHLRVRSVHLQPGRLVGPDLRSGHPGARAPDGVAAHAQPVGPCAQGHPRGRGCRARPRQERLLLQDAGADPRWRASARSAASSRRCPPRSSPASTCRR